MLEKLTDNIRECYQHAQDCERQAAQQFDPRLRQDFHDAARRCRFLAKSYETTEQITLCSLIRARPGRSRQLADSFIPGA
jgi:hypothetical protein